jgi:hypothetical protein
MTRISPAGIFPVREREDMSIRVVRMRDKKEFCAGDE